MNQIKMSNIKIVAGTFLLLILTLGAFAQTSNDQVSIIKQLVEHPDLAEYYTNNDGSIKQRYIIQYPYVFPNDVVTNLDEEVAIIVEQDNLPADADVWARFRGIGVSKTVASGVMNLYQKLPGDEQEKALIIYFELQKNDDNWSVTNLNIRG